MLATTTPFAQFFDTDGSPLDQGLIFFGQVNQNPETAPSPVFWDLAGTIPAAQPIRTLNGTPARAGAPAVVYTADKYSITIRNKRGVLIAYAPEWPTTNDISGALAAPGGSALVGYRPLGASPTTSTVQDVLRRVQYATDNGAVADGTAGDDAGYALSKVVSGVVYVPPANRLRVSEASFNRVNAIVPAGYMVTDGNTWIADDGFGGQGAVNVIRSTSAARDAIKADHYGTGTGYGVHAVSYATNGSGVGGASWGIGAGVVGNKRGDGAASAGNGGAFSRLESGNGSGVYGYKTGAGLGNGAYGENDGAGEGAAVLGLRSGGGTGQAVRALRQGSGNGDAVLAENLTTGSGHAVTATRIVGGVTKSVGYLGYWDLATDESVGVYGAALAGLIQWAGRFDGSIKVSGASVLAGGAEPLTDNTATIGNASKRFNAIWAATGTINTSDRNAKKDVRPLDDTERAVGRRLRELVRVFRFNDGNRLHAGLIAQDVAQAFVDEGLDPAEYAMWCEDEIFDEKREAVGTEMVDVIGEDGETTQAERTIYQVTKTSLGKRQGLRYDQVLAFIVSVAL